MRDAGTMLNEEKEDIKTAWSNGCQSGIIIGGVIGSILITFCLLVLSAQAEPLNRVRKEKQQTLELPEEINQAKKGDLLQVEKTGDTLGFGFYRGEKFKK